MARGWGGTYYGLAEGRGVVTEDWLGYQSDMVRIRQESVAI